MEHLDVVMVRADLAGVPQFDVPAPCAVRAYRPGDAEAWRRIPTPSDANGPIPPGRFVQQFGRDERVVGAPPYWGCPSRPSILGPR